MHRSSTAGLVLALAVASCATPKHYLAFQPRPPTYADFLAGKELAGFPLRQPIGLQQFGKACLEDPALQAASREFHTYWCELEGPDSWDLERIFLSMGDDAVETVAVFPRWKPEETDDRARAARLQLEVREPVGVSTRLGVLCATSRARYYAIRTLEADGSPGMITGALHQTAATLGINVPGQSKSLNLLFDDARKQLEREPAVAHALLRTLEKLGHQEATLLLASYEATQLEPEAQKTARVLAAWPAADPSSRWSLLKELLVRVRRQPFLRIDPAPLDPGALAQELAASVEPSTEAGRFLRETDFSERALRSLSGAQWQRLTRSLLMFERGAARSAGASRIEPQGEGSIRDLDAYGLAYDRARQSFGAAAAQRVEALTSARAVLLERLAEHLRRAEAQGRLATAAALHLVRLRALEKPVPEGPLHAPLPQGEEDAARARAHLATLAQQLVPRLRLSTPAAQAALDAQKFGEDWGLKSLAGVSPLAFAELTGAPLVVEVGPFEGRNVGRSVVDHYNSVRRSQQVVRDNSTAVVKHRIERQALVRELAQLPSTIEYMKGKRGAGGWSLEGTRFGYSGSSRQLRQGPKSGGQSDYVDVTPSGADVYRPGTRVRTYSDDEIRAAERRARELQGVLDRYRDAPESAILEWQSYELPYQDQREHWAGWGERLLRVTERQQPIWEHRQVQDLSRFEFLKFEGSKELELEAYDQWLNDEPALRRYVETRFDAEVPALLQEALTGLVARRIAAAPLGKDWTAADAELERSLRSAFFGPPAKARLPAPLLAAFQWTRLSPRAPGGRGPRIDAASGVVHLEQPADSPWHLAFSPDDSRIAAANRKGLWVDDADTGELVMFAELDAPAQRLAWSPDGRRLIVSGGKTVWVYDALRGKRLHTFTVTRNGDASFAGPGASDWVVVHGEKQAFAWNTRTGERGPQLTVDFTVLGKQGVSADGQRACIPASNDAYVFELETARVVLKLKGLGTFDACSLSADGTLLALTKVGWEGGMTAALYDVASKQKLEAPAEWAKGAAGGIFFSPDGLLYAYLDSRTGQVVQRASPKGKAAGVQFVEHLDPGAIQALEYTRDGASLVLLNLEEARLFRRDTGALAARVPSATLQVALTRGGERIAVATEKAFHLVNAPVAAQEERAPSRGGAHLFTTLAALSEDRKRFTLSLGSERGLQPGDDVLSEVGHLGKIVSVAAGRSEAELGFMKPEALERLAVGAAIIIRTNDPRK